MYSETLKPKIDTMFVEISDNVYNIIIRAPSLETAGDRIVSSVVSETGVRSKTMLSDLCSHLYKEVLDSLADIPKQNRFYEANLRQEIFAKYSFEVPNDGITFKEADRICTSIAAGAGVALTGGGLVFVLSPAAPIVPIVLVIAVSLAVFCVSYFKVTPCVNRARFREAVDKYLDEVKRSYIAWFDEAEKYFNTRADEIRQSM